LFVSDKKIEDKRKTVRISFEAAKYTRITKQTSQDKSERPGTTRMESFLSFETV